MIWQDCPGIGWCRLSALEHHCGDLSAAWITPLERLAAVPGMGPAVLGRLEAYRRRLGPDPLGAVRRTGLSSRVLLPGDLAFPRALLELERPPLALHWLGRGSLWSPLRRRQAVAVVGTRHPSRHGLAMARAIGSALARAGWPVVSGLAEGIDAAAHRGCLVQGGRPVAVLGTPLERVYPRHHEELQRLVAAQGLLVTEQPSGAGVRPGHFAARNRLQVALARAVVLVECPVLSGALQSAALAWNQGLPLWVVPADAGKLSAAGSNRLLALGASALLDPSDLIRQLGPGPLKQPACSGGSPAGDQGEILRLLGQGASLEDLCQELGRPAADVARCLLELEIAGRVVAEPGLCWRPV
ncbi:DNA-processing protein DprA [Cyanobium sp. Morenito 9A2]|uniref:DNA-processing protein DprA n=1 Tax=Cyanobium sp. Morenito 9A2 TaxID=2823718 RepID=UPI0028F4342C|nr:DNA-processing protein DprA [Cyanobium sp. Morenito 9A2]